MKWAAAFLERLLRGKAGARLLRGMGIEPVQFWILMDLFEVLTERREGFSQFGRGRMSLQAACWVYSALSGLMVLFMIASKMPPAMYFAFFLGMTTFLLATLLVPETSNSLINPIEALILAHQPINGATYTAAKLTHLIRIVLYVAPGMNLIPALAGLMLPGVPLYYPLVHMLAAVAAGVIMALCCCALFGWLIRFVPASRLKTAGFVAELSPWALVGLLQIRRFVGLDSRIPFLLLAYLGAHKVWLAAVCAIGAGMAAAGIRCLSGDYLVRVTAIAQGKSRPRRRSRSSFLGAMAGRLFGGPPAVAGYEYVSRMMAREWQFRRQLAPVLPALLVAGVAIYREAPKSPFSSAFTGIHILPHALGYAFYLICSVLVFGSSRQGVWFFQTCPPEAFQGFVRGIFARLLTVLVAPQAILWPVLAWLWGWREASLFTAYSVGVSSLYLGLELRLIDGFPFSRQPEGTQSLYALPMLMAGGAVGAAAVALQYFLVFRSTAFVAGVTVVVAAASWILTRRSLRVFEASIRYQLAVLGAESQALCAEIEV